MGLATIEKKAAPFYPVGQVYPHGIMPLTTTAGERVTHDDAIGDTAVWRALRLASETVASLPVSPYQKTGPNQREKVTDHPSSELLTGRMNRWMKAFPGKEVMHGHVMFRGNAYAHEVRDRRGRLVELVPMHPSLVTVEVKPGGLTYVYEDPDKGRRELDRDEVFHLTGFSSNGIIGYDPIHLMREALGMALSARKHGSRMMAAGGRGPGIIHTDQKIDPEGKNEYADAWNERFAKNPLGVAVLDRGLQWEAMGFTAREAELLGMLKFSVNDVARIFGIQPHLLMDLERATFSNIEQQALEFAEYTIRPWLRRWENALNVDLLTPEERASGLFFKFTIEDILAADIKSRFESYARAWQNGWMSTNEIRAKEDMNPIDGGDETVLPMNVLPRSIATEVVAAGETGNPGLGGGGDQGKSAPALLESKNGRDARLFLARRRARATLSRLIRGQATRMITSEVEAGLNALERADTPAEFADFLDDHYDGYDAKVQAAFSPLLVAQAETLFDQIAAEVGFDDDMPPELNQFVSEYSETAGRRWVVFSRNRLQGVIADAEDFRTTVEEEYATWQENRVEKIAGYETVRSEGAIARAAYGLAGALFLRWVAFGKSCPMCNRLDGKVVAVQRPFLNAGEELDVEGAALYVSDRPKFNPPLHGGCDCGVFASIF